jgi:invasion protein IalB
VGIIREAHFFASLGAVSASVRNVLAGAALFAGGLVLGWLGERQLAPVPRDVPSIVTFDDWRLACPAASSGTKEGRGACVARQDVVDGKAGAHIATLILAGTTLTVTVPFNVLIASQLGLAIGDGKPRMAPYVTCTQAGCIATFAIDEPLRAALRQGARGRILFARMDKQVVQANFSLRGFARADDVARHAAGFWRWL